MQNIFNFKLRNAPPSAKVMVTAFLLSLGLAYVYAVANIALVVGLTPKDIAIHYYGAENVIQEVQTSAEESLDLDSLETEKKVEIGPRPSFKNLVQEGHFHLFGMTTFFFLMTFLGLFTGIGEKAKMVLVGVPFVAIVFDNVSFMATRFLGPNFSYLTAVSGAVMGVTFTALWIVIVLELIKKRESV
ncbi:MAG: hypothetical protein ACK5V3_13580 [Bdellovibrionales bacterium]